MEPTNPLNQFAQPVQMPASTPVSPNVESDQVIATAKSLVSQYRQNPYHLNEELDQLKGAYLQSHYHITPNPAEH